MWCKLSESNTNRRKYVIYPYIDSEYHSGYIVAEKYDGYWNIELMHIVPQDRRKGYGSYLLKYVMNDLKGIIVTHPTTTEALNFFQKHNFICGFRNKLFLYYHNT